MFRTSTDVMKIKIQDLPTFYSVHFYLVLSYSGTQGTRGRGYGSVPGGTEYELRL